MPRTRPAVACPFAKSYSRPFSLRGCLFDFPAGAFVGGVRFGITRGWIGVDFGWTIGCGFGTAFGVASDGGFAFG
jgi:hypothetical protein